MTRTRPQAIGISLSIYDYDLNVFVHPDVREYERWMRRKIDRRYSLPENHVNARALFSFRDTGAVCMWLPRKPRTPNELGTLAHECAHVAIHLMDHIGQRVDLENDEPMTYVVGYLVREILGRLK